MIYRSIVNLTTLCGCQGVNGGGWAHYVGQEKVRPQAAWSQLAFGLDWTVRPVSRTEPPFIILPPTSGDMTTSTQGTSSRPGRADPSRHMADYNVDRRPPGLVALLSAVQPEPTPYLP